MNNTTNNLHLIHDHPTDDGITCVFFAQCPENSDLDIYRSVYATALEGFGDKDRARRMAEAYMAGRMRTLPAFVK